MTMQTRSGQIALCTVFGLVTLVPTLLWPVGTRLNSRLNENRVKPDLKVSLGSLSEALDSTASFRGYYNDSFPFRDAGIRADAFLRFQVAGNTWSDRVLIGSDGWLFLRRTRAGIPVTLPIAPFTAAELQQWVDLLEARGRRMEAMGSRYVLVIAPDKASIYAEQRPSVLRSLDHDVRLQQLLTALQASEWVTCVDLRPSLLAAKTRYAQLYYRTDTHWNAIAGRIAAGEICRALNLADWSDKDTDYVTQNDDVGYQGDLQRLLGTAVSAAERRLLHTPTAGFSWEKASPECRLISSEPDESQPLVTEIPPARRVSGGTRATALLFHDSFMIELQPFLSECFVRAVFVWEYELNETLAGAESPDFVFDVFVQRQLNNPPPAAFRAQ